MVIPAVLLLFLLTRGGYSMEVAHTRCVEPPDAPFAFRSRRWDVEYIGDLSCACGNNVILTNSGRGTKAVSASDGAVRWTIGTYCDFLGCAGSRVICLNRTSDDGSLEYLFSGLSCSTGTTEWISHSLAAMPAQVSVLAPPTSNAEGLLSTSSKMAACRLHCLPKREKHGGFSTRRRVFHQQVALRQGSSSSMQDRLGQDSLWRLRSSTLLRSGLRRAKLCGGPQPRW